MYFDMDDSLGFIVNKTSLLLKAAFNRKIKGYGISPEQWSLIFRVVERSGLTQKELSDSTYKDQANITRSIDRLEQKGFLQRVANDSDRRIINIFPTKKAQELVDEIAPISTIFNQEMTEGFSSDEKKTLIELLKRVYINLEKIK